MKIDISRNRDSYGKILGVCIVALFMLMATVFAVTLFSSTTEAGPTDYTTYDFGDAPDPTYPTLLASDGARHGVIVSNAFYLGSSVDVEANGLPNAGATGDDLNGIDDEDGVTIPTLQKGVTASITVIASAAGKLDAWVDFNDDGDWADSGEQIFASYSLSTGANVLSVPVPKAAVIGTTFARFRFSSTGGLLYTGPADDGEVEDYAVTIECETIIPNYWQNFQPSDWWTADQTPDVSVQVKDLESGLDVSTAEYRYSTDGGATWSAWATASCTGVDGTNDYQTISVLNVPFNQDSKDKNVIEFRILDMCANIGTYQHIVKVDTKGPPQTIEYGLPHEQYVYPPNGKTYALVGGNTLIYINSTDEGIGSKNLTYYIQWGPTFGIWPYVSVDFTTVEDNQVVPGNPYQTDADQTVGKISVQIYEDESCWHEIHYWCYDYLGHRSPLAGGNFTDFVVDCTAPNSTWSLMGPTDPINVWMGSCTYKIINATDAGCIPGGSGVSRIDWFIHRVLGETYELYQSGTVYDDGVGDYNPADGLMSIRINVDEDCEHYISHRVYDDMGNYDFGLGIETPNKQYHKIDVTAPETELSYTGLNFIKNDDEVCLTTSTVVTINTNNTGTEPCIYPETDTFFRVFVVAQNRWYPDATTGQGAYSTYLESDSKSFVNGVWWFDYSKTFSFTEDCIHYLEFFAQDPYCNVEDAHNITHYVDGTPPTIIKTVGDPKMSIPGTDDYCVRTSTPITIEVQEGGCCPCDEATIVEYRIWQNDVWSQWMTYEGPITFYEECKHYLEIRAIDCLGNQVVDNETFYVDNSPPTINKAVGDPNCPIPGTANYCVTTDTQITLTATNVGCCPCPDPIIEYRVYYNGAWSEWTLYTCYIDFDEECEHTLQVRAYDCLGNGYTEQYWDTEIFYVDESAPVIEKTVGTPNCPVPGTDNYCVTTDTEITLSAYQQDCCPYGDITLEYRIGFDGGWTEWAIYDGAITFDEACEHVLEVRATDCLGNQAFDSETFYVDDSAPTIIKTVGTPNCPVPGTDNYCVTTDTLITLSATDNDCCPVGDITIEYAYWYNDQWYDWTTYTAPFSFSEQCEHELYVKAYDCLGNGLEEADYDVETFYVDDSAPTIDKIVGEPKHLIPDTDDYCVTTSTEITLSAYNDDCCPYGDITLEYRIWYGGIWSSWMPYTEPISFDEECEHQLEVRATDCLGNEATDLETFYVDESAPIIEKIVGTPNCPIPGTDDYCITTATGITISAVDQGCCSCPDPLVEYRIYYNGQWTDWIPYYGSIYFAYECEHILEVRATDCLGNYVVDSETFYVDESAPIIEKTVGTPNCPIPDTDDFCVTTDTLITLSAYNTGCCLDSGITIEYGYWYDDVWSGWMTYTAPFSFDEECEHELVVRAYDCLGNGYTEQYWETETFYVDDSAPIIEKTVGKPQMHVEGTDDYCVTTDTEITLSAYNGEDCCGWSPVYLEYRIWYADVWTTWTTYTEPFTFDQECMHYLEVRATDCLGNEELDNETFYVDDTAPTINKIVGTPNCPIPGTDDYCVTTETEITVSAVDAGCCPGCDVELYYRIWYDGEWTEWMEYEVPISFNKECEHVLEIRATDCLGNEVVHSETFYVDETAPELVKTVGDPHFFMGYDDDGHEVWMIYPGTDICFTIDESNDCCPSTEATILYRYWYLGQWTEWMTYTECINLEEGCVHYLEAKAYDCLGNGGDVIDNETFWVCAPGGGGSADPNVEIIFPTQGSTQGADTLEVILHAYDDETSWEDLNVFLWIPGGRRDAPYLYYEVTPIDGQEDYFHAFVPIFNYQDGAQITLDAIALDEDGNTGSAVPVSFYVDSTIVWDQWMQYGWNRLTLPYEIGCDTSVERLLSSVWSDFDWIFHYDMVTHVWTSYSNDLDPLYVTLHDLAAGEIYWVHITKPIGVRYYLGLSDIVINTPTDGAELTELNEINGITWNSEDRVDEVDVAIYYKDESSVKHYWSGSVWDTTVVYHPCTLTMDYIQNWAFDSSGVDWIPGQTFYIKARATDTFECYDYAQVSFEITSQCDASKTYTTNADFDEGIFVGSVYAENDQLQITPGQGITYPVMWIANSGESSVSKWDTNQNKELARYKTFFYGGSSHSGPAPSRTCVDSDGNCYVANRQFYSNKAPDVLKILANDYIDRNGNGVMDTSVDANNNGVIEPSEMLPLVDSNGNNKIDPEEIQDERIAWAVEVGPQNGLGRSLSIDLDGNLWLGCYNSQQYYKISGVDGSLLAGPISTSGHTPYGSLVDKHGILWGASLTTNLLRLDTSTNAVTLLSHSQYGGNYGIALGYDSNDNTIVYLGSWQGYTFIKYDSLTNTFSTPAAIQYSSRGIATDSQGYILAGYSGTGLPNEGGVSKFAPDGTLIWSKPSQVGQTEARGVVVDSNDDVWTIHLSADKIGKYSGVDGTPLGWFPTGSYPYTYSDAAGLSYSGSVTTGKWSAVHDSQAPATVWNYISWTSNEPEGTSITVKTRSSEDQITWSSWENVQNGVALSSTPAGQYIEVEVTMKITSSEVSPILYDLTIDGTCAGAPQCEPAFTLEKTVWHDEYWDEYTEVDVGDTVTFNITVETGPESCTFLNGQLDDYLPSGLSYVQGSTMIQFYYNGEFIDEVSGEDCDPTITSGDGYNILTWASEQGYGENILANSIIYLEFEAEVMSCGDFTNTANATGYYNCCDYIQNEDTAQVWAYCPV